MRRMHAPLLLLFLSLGLAACQSTRPPAGPDATPGVYDAMEADLLAAMEASAAAWNRADLDGHVAIYSDESTFMTRNGPLRGRDAIRDVLARGFWNEGRPAQQLRFEELDVRPLGPDHALLTGRFVLTGGDRPEATGRFSTVWARTPEGWRLIHDHSS